MPSTPRARELSKDELDALLNQPIIARLGTMTEDGYPHIVPVWTEWDGKFLWIVARGRAQYVANILRHPKVAVSFAREEVDGARALIMGRAQVVEGPSPLSGRTLEIARSMGRRYIGEEGDAYLEESKEWPRSLIQITPEKIISWGSYDWHPKYKD